MARARRFPNPSELKKTLTPATPWTGRDRLPKDETVNFRVAAEEKREMATVAASFGLGVSEYLLRLHRLAVAIQGVEEARQARRGLPKRKPS